MYQALLKDSRFIELLLKLDAVTAAEAKGTGCSCGGRLHRANYERKARGGPAVGPECAIRLSFCCATEGCRRRSTPPSLRFLGRKVFFAVVVLLVPVLRDGPTPERLSRLCKEFSVSSRTVRRWCRFWREVFVTSRVWSAARGRFAVPVEIATMPRSMVDAFPGSPADQVVSVLRLVTGQAL